MAEAASDANPAKISNCRWENAIVGKSQPCQLPRRWYAQSVQSYLIYLRILTTGGPNMCERDRGILILANGVQSLAAALGTVGLYRSGASQLLAFRQTRTNLHLINAPAEEFHFPPLPPEFPDAALLPAFVEVQTVFSHA